MLLKNKKTGEIKDVQLGNHNDPSDGIIVVYGDKGQPREPRAQYSSLAELVEDWEDYEEPKEYWYISDAGIVHKAVYIHSGADLLRRAFGNYFETKEEAEKAVEKLKAWKSLKDREFGFTGIANDGHGMIYIKTNLHREEMDEDRMYQNSTEKALDLLFGGEDE